MIYHFWEAVWWFTFFLNQDEDGDLKAELVKADFIQPWHFIFVLQTPTQAMEN